MSEWKCPKCPYRIRLDHPAGGVKEAISAHNRAHEDAEASTGSRSSEESG